VQREVLSPFLPFLCAERQDSEIGFELALNWLCFPGLSGASYFHKILSIKRLRLFRPLEIGFVLHFILATESTENAEKGGFV